MSASYQMATSIDNRRLNFPLPTGITIANFWTNPLDD